MNASHVAVGGGSAGLLSVLLVWGLGKVHFDITTEEAASIGATALAAGSGLAHRIGSVGIKGLFSGLWNGGEDEPAA